MERRLTHQLQPTEVKLTVDVATPRLQPTERGLTLQLQPTEEKLTHQPQATEEKLTLQPLTTEVNHTDTKHEVQTDYFAVLFQDHQTSQKNFKIDYCIFIFICVFDTFNKLH